MYSVDATPSERLQALIAEQRPRTRAYGEALSPPRNLSFEEVTATFLPNFKTRVTTLIRRIHSSRHALEGAMDVSVVEANFERIIRSLGYMAREVTNLATEQPSVGESTGIISANVAFIHRDQQDAAVITSQQLVVPTEVA